MAVVNKITKAEFADDQATADISRVSFELYDDALTASDDDYHHGFVTYDFTTGKPVASGIRDLAEVADVKTLIDAMVASRAKNTISLPTLVKSITEKDGSGSVTKYTERY